MSMNIILKADKQNEFVMAAQGALLPIFSPITYHNLTQLPGEETIPDFITP